MSDSNTDPSSSKKEEKGSGKQKGKAVVAVAPKEESAAQIKQKEMDDLKKLVLARPIKPQKNNDSHAFWDTQPVPKMDQTIEDTKNEPLEPAVPIDQLQQDPYKLPEAFEWIVADVDSDQELQEIYTLLNENYVEDDDAMFRFDYSMPFLRWALKPPGFHKDWHIGVRVKANRKLVGFITGVPAVIDVSGKHVELVEINFLCVHKKLQGKRLAPILIKEVTRRVNLKGIFQAVYTAGVVLPKPVAKCQYFHRSINPKKLVDVGFSSVSHTMTLSRMIKLYTLPKETTIPGIRPLQPDDVPQACAILATYLKKFTFAATFNEAEFAHWFLPRDGIVNTFVVEDSKHKVTDICSFYTLPSTIINNPKYKTLKAAYSYYNVANSVSPAALMNDALILAKQLDFDVFNCLNIMDNDAFIKELKFGAGDGQLQYYLYNWLTPTKQPANVGLVLL